MRFIILPICALASLALTACAPDAWRADDGYDVFLDQVRIKCSDARLGRITIRQLMPNANTTNAYFMDVTSEFYHRKISQENYMNALEASYGARSDSPGIRCILDQMP